MSDADRYKLGDALGTGATSEVFVATDTKLRREVAFKRLLDHVAEDPTVRKSFHREAQALAKLRHKNVVAVHDYSGPESPTLYLVMDLVRGKNLSGWLAERGRLDEPIVWAVLHELASALEACHAQGVVHRDLKPDNVIVTPNGRLMLVDFGIARSYDAADGAVGSGVGTQVMGTPDYMSPEQATSNELTGASDVFSLGSVAYFMTTAKKPFEGDGVLATLKKIAAGSYLPLKNARPEISQQLADLVARCLQTEIGKRPSSKDIAAEAKKQLAQMSQKAEALLADWVAAGALGTSKQAKQKELDQLFARLGTALAAKDKLEIKRCRKRILELDPDNESVFEMRAEPLRDAPAKEAPKTVMMTAPPTLRLLDDKPSRWPLVLTFLLGALAGVLVTVVALKLQSRI
ncbi:MAG: protein kinase [Deltaproteobacteria bacterium]|nr:protein kinase [Deltaproteobacteria bacterium]